MKKHLFVVFIFNLALLVSASASATSAPLAPLAIYSCPLNKSFSLVITLQGDERGVTQVLLEEKDFLGRLAKHVAELKAPRLHHIDYGNVVMLSQSFGRSGYVFIRIEEAELDYRGYLDINLFSRQNVFNGGTLTPVVCYKLQ